VYYKALQYGQREGRVTALPWDVVKEISVLSEIGVKIIFKISAYYFSQISITNKQNKGKYFNCYGESDLVTSEFQDIQTCF
jgi:hypothetical protein